MPDGAKHHYMDALRRKGFVLAFLRKRLPSLFIFLNSFLISSLALANPIGGQVVAGQATISNPHTQMVEVHQTSQKAIINWEKFNIQANEHTHFTQPNKQSITLNRINPTNGISAIHGKLSANGQIWLINPAGIYFGSGAVVNVSGLLVTTADIADDDFMAGNYHFVQSPEWNGAIINEGLISLADEGIAILAAPGVENRGVILAHLGQVILASGKEFTIDFYGDQLIQFSANAAVTEEVKDEDGMPLPAAVSNRGKIVANGGKVLMTAKTAGQVLDQSINMDGYVEAKSVKQHRGEVVLMAGEGTANVTGKMIASGREAGEKGGKVKVLGRNVILAKRARIVVSGADGGGEILIGGDYQGKNLSIPNANFTFIGKDVKLIANALTYGQGGKVIVWANDATLFYGTIFAKGGKFGGNGGFVETSGKRYLEALGSVNASAPYGLSGEWLLDPANVTISGSATSNGTFSGGNPNTFTTTANSAIANVSTIQTSLNGGTSVTILTTPNGSENGDITVSSPISKTAGGAATLTLTANNATGGVINLNQTITSTNGALTVTLNGASINLGANITTNNGAINFNNPVSLTSAITLNAGSGAVNFASTLNGANTLTVNSTGATTFSGAVGGLTPLTSLTTNTGGTSVINASSIATTGAISFGEAVTLGTIAKNITSTGGAISFASTINGGFDLSLSGSGVTLSGIVGGTAALTSLSVTGNTAINTTAITTTGSQSYHNAITLGANLALNTTNSDITADSTIDRDATARTLTANAGSGNVTLSGNVGGGGSLGAVTLNSTGATTLGGTLSAASLTTNASGTTLLNGGSVTTSGTQTYNDAVVLGANTTLTTTNNIITFASTLDRDNIAARNLTTNSGSAATTLTGNIGAGVNGALGAITLNSTGTTTLTGTVSAASLATNAGGTTAINGGTVTTTDVVGQIYNDAVTLNADTTLNANAGAITFGSTLNSLNATLRSLALNTSGVTTFGGVVGATRALTTLTTDAPGSTVITGNITTSTTQTYNDPVTLNANSTLTTTNSNVTFASSIDTDASARTLTISAGTGGISLAGNIGAGINGALGAFTLNNTGTTTLSGTINAASLTTNAGGSTVINGGSVQTSGGQTFNDAVTIGANTLFASTGAGAINFVSTLNGGFDLSVDTGGTTTFGGAVGGVTPLLSITTNAGGTTAINGGAVTTSDLSGQAYQDAVTVNANTVLTAGIGLINFASTLNSASGTARTITFNSSNTTTFGGDVGTTNILSTFTTDSGGETVINAATISTGGVQTFNDPVTLNTNTSFNTTNDNVVFAGTVDRGSTASNMTVNAGTAAITFTGNVGGGSNGALGSMTLNSTGTTTFSGTVDAGDLATNSGGTTLLNGASITTSGSLSFGDAVTLALSAKSLTSTGGSISFANTINGAFGLTLSGDTGVSFAGIVGGSTALTNLEIFGGTTISTTGITTSGTQEYHNNITLQANATLTTTNNNILIDSNIDRDASARNLTFSAGSGNINLAGNIGAGINGALGAVTINNTGITTLDGSLNSASITTNAGGSTHLNSGVMTTSGTQTYNDAVTLGANTLFTTTNSAITFASTLDRDSSQRTITTNTGSAGVTFTGNVGGGSNGALGAMALNSTGTVTFSGVVTADSVTTDAGGTTAINGGSITTSGSGGQIYNDAVTLNAAAILSSGTGPITFASTLNSATATARALTLNSTGIVTFNGAVGTTRALASLTTNNGGETHIATPNITTTGAQTYNDPVTLADNVTLTTTNSAVTFAQTLDRDTLARSLLVSAGSGGISLLGNVGAGVNGALGDITLNNTGATTISGTVAASSFTTNAGGSTTINGGGILTSAAQTYNDAVILGADSLFTSTNNNAITFGSTINGGFSLTVATGGATTFSGIIGGTTALVSLTTDSGGTTAINGGTITTTGSAGQIFNDATTLNATTTLNAGSGAITFGDTLNSFNTTARNLTVNSTGVTTFNNDIGSTNPIGILTTNIGGSTIINSTNITTSGAQAYNDAVTLENPLTLTTSNGTVNFADTIERGGSASDLAINSGTADITLAGNIGLSNGALGAINLTTTGTVTLGGTIAANSIASNSLTSITGGSITTTGSSGQIYNGAVTLGANTILTANSGPITFATTLNSANTTARSLTLNSSGITTLGGTIGATNALSSLTTDSPGSVVMSGSSITTTSAQTYNDPVTVTGTTTLLASAANVDISLQNSANNFGGALNFGVVGGGSIHDLAFTNQSALDFQTLNLTGSLTVTAGGDITQAGALSVPGTATFTAGSHNITLNNANNNFGTVVINSGNSVSLTDMNDIAFGTSNISNSLNVTSSGAVSQTGAITVPTLDITATNGITLTSDNAITNFSATNTNNLISLVNVANAFTMGNVQNGGGDISVTNTGNLTTGGAITTNGGSVSLTTLSPDANERVLTLGGSGIATQGGGISLSAANPNNNAAALIINALLDSSPGTGGTLSIGGGILLNVSPNLGAGNITLNGNGLDLTLNTLTFTQSTRFAVNRYLTVAGLLTTLNQANLTLIGDQFNTGVGGVLIQSTGGINSSGSVTLGGSSLANINSTAGIVIQSETPIVAAGGISFLNSLEIQRSVNMNTTNAPIEFNGIVGSNYRLTLSSGTEGNITFNGNTTLGGLIISRARNVTNNARMNIDYFTEERTMGVTDLGQRGFNVLGLALVTANRAIGAINVGALTLSVNTANLTGFIDSQGGIAGLSKIMVTNPVTPGTIFFDGIDLAIKEVNINVIIPIFLSYQNYVSKNNPPTPLDQLLAPLAQQKCSGFGGTIDLCAGE